MQTEAFTSESDHLARLKDAAPRRNRDLIPNLALFVGMICAVLQLVVLRRDVQRAADADASPLTYQGAWKPQRAVYHPGEYAVFTFVRSATFDLPRLYVRNLRTLENLETGASYALGETARKVRESGTRSGVSVVQIPDSTPAGKRYVLTGLVSSQTTRRTLPVGYDSEEFEIRAWGSEQERQEQREQRPDLPDDGTDEARQDTKEPGKAENPVVSLFAETPGP